MQASLLLLRSAQLIWKPKTRKGKPWNSHHLYLHCVIDQCLWSKVGLEQAQQELLEKTQNIISRYEAKETEQPLTDSEKTYIKGRQTSLKRLKTFDLTHLNPTRFPSFFQDSEIIIGVSFGLKIPVTLAIVNIHTKANLSFLSPKQLLSRTHTILTPQLSDQTHQASMIVLGDLKNTRIIYHWCLFDEGLCPNCNNNLPIDIEF